MADEVKILQDQVRALEQKLADYEKESPKRGYYALNRIVNIQIDYINSFEIKAHIGADPKEDKTYERAMKICDGLENYIMALIRLKDALGLTGKKEIDLKDIPYIETVATKRD